MPNHLVEEVVVAFNTELDGYKVIHTFPLSIFPKMNVIALSGFELAQYNVCI